DVREPVQGVHEVGAVDGFEWVLAVEHEVTAHSGGEIEYDIHSGLADTTHHLPVQCDVPGPLARLDVSHMDVHHGRSGVRRLDRGSGYLLRCHGDVFALAHRVTRAGQRAGDDHFVVHGRLSTMLCSMKSLSCCRMWSTE